MIHPDDAEAQAGATIGLCAIGSGSADLQPGMIHRVRRTRFLQLCSHWKPPAASDMIGHSPSSNGDESLSLAGPSCLESSVSGMAKFMSLGSLGGMEPSVKEAFRPGFRVFESDQVSFLERDVDGKPVAICSFYTNVRYTGELMDSETALSRPSPCDFALQIVEKTFGKKRPTGMSGDNRPKMLGAASGCPNTIVALSIGPCSSANSVAESDRSGPSPAATAASCASRGSSCSSSEQPRSGVDGSSPPSHTPRSGDGQRQAVQSSQSLSILDPWGPAHPQQQEQLRRQQQQQQQQRQYPQSQAGSAAVQNRLDPLSISVPRSQPTSLNQTKISPATSFDPTVLSPFPSMIGTPMGLGDVWSPMAQGDALLDGLATPPADLRPGSPAEYNAKRQQVVHTGTMRDYSGR